MPEDKWGIPFFYSTKKTAGNTGKGSGFFWQQNNDIFKDNKSGMVRLGKEGEAVDVINSSTGEWEFPFSYKYSIGDGLALSGPTGHHSGGENHGCQGFTYMIDNTWNTNPATFRFRKETYHVQYDTDPITKTWTHPKVNYKIIGSGWNGYGWVRYNKKDGRSSGKDSVICECWWNPHPDSDIKDWTMLKRTEDKGAGKSNWGVKATCDGADYQVGTWSNIQFRFKSSGSDFSLHPLEPETEDGKVIHSIGKEDMSFSDSEGRGYGYQARMPRDIEMKCLFKIDSNNGIVRFKNLSLREIDPNISFDDNPEEPEEPPSGGGGSSGGTSTITGSFRFVQNINTIGASACQGVGVGSGGGGETGSAMFYEVADLGHSTELSNTSTFQNRNRVGEQCDNSSSRMRGKVLNQADVWLRKVGSPASTPHVFLKVYNSTGATRYQSPTEIDPSTLTTSFVKKTFDCSSNTLSINTGDVIAVAYDTGSSTDYIEVAYDDKIIPNCTYVNFENGVWEPKPTTRDLCAYLWE